MLEVAAEIAETREVMEHCVALLVRVVEPLILPGLQVVVLGVEEEGEGVRRLLHELDLIAHRKLAET